MKKMIALIFAGSLMFVACGPDAESLGTEGAEKECECRKLKKDGTKSEAKACREEEKAIRAQGREAVKDLSGEDKKAFVKERKEAYKAATKACDMVRRPDAESLGTAGAEKDCECSKLRKDGTKSEAKACRDEGKAIKAQFKEAVKEMSEEDKEAFEKEAKEAYKAAKKACGPDAESLGTEAGEKKCECRKLKKDGTKSEVKACRDEGKALKAQFKEALKEMSDEDKEAFEKEANEAYKAARKACDN